MRNKIKTALLLGVLSASFILTGCDKVKAELPTDDPILSFEDYSTKIYNNTEKQIYDALVTAGDTNSEKVLNQVLYLYAQSMYAPFYTEGETVGLYEAVGAYTDSADTTKLDTIINAYPVYQIKKDNGEIDLTASRERVLSFFNEILFRINESFFGYTKDSTYQERNLFKEEKFYDAQVKNYYDLGKVDDGDFKSVQFDGNVTISDKALKDTTLNNFFTNRFETYKNYIKINLLPDIYRKELTAEFLIKENYTSTIKNVAARKVEYITLPADNVGYVRNLLEAYHDKVVAPNKQGENNAYGLSFLDRLYKGVDKTINDDTTGIASQIYKAANWTKSTITVGTETYNYYIESQFGTICEKLKVLLNSDNRYSENFESYWNSFTSSGTYTYETGFEIQMNELLAKSEITSGWYTPGGLSSLPDSLKNRVFKTQVADEIVPLSAKRAYPYIWKYDYAKEDARNYLIPKSPATNDPHPYIVKDGTNYTIVEINEASNSAKFDTESENAYTVDKAFRISRTIAYNLASNDTWVKSAKSYYVNKMAIIYHDEYVLNYFKTTFPDLFD